LDNYVKLFLEANDPDQSLKEPILLLLTPKFFNDLPESSQDSPLLPAYPGQAFREFLDRYDSDNETDDADNDTNTDDDTDVETPTTAAPTPPNHHHSKLQEHSPRKSLPRHPPLIPPRTITPRNVDPPSHLPTGRKRNSAVRHLGKKPSAKVYPWAFSI
jgi:hypothetical protein